LRIPGWCRTPMLKVNGKTVNVKASTLKGYARLQRTWKSGDTIDLVLPMSAERVVARPEARQICGRVALMRGPVVYCLEQVDNGAALNDIRLPRSAALRCTVDKRLFGGVPVIRSTGLKRKAGGWGDTLYNAQPPQYVRQTSRQFPTACGRIGSQERCWSGSGNRPS